MNKPEKKKLDTASNQELTKAKAAGSVGIFILVVIIIVILILAFLGFLLAGFINTP